MTQRAPKAWLRAVRCGTAVICNPAQRYADDGAEHERDGDQFVVNDAAMQKRAANCQQHARFARPDPVAGGRRANSSTSAKE